VSAGARTKCTPETIERLCEALELGATVRIACNCAGISVTTYHRWISEAEAGDQDRREFWDAVKAARGAAALGHLETLRAASQAGEWKASAWWLERVEGYTRAVRVETSRPPDPAEDMTDAEIEARLRRIRAGAAEGEE